MKQLAVITGGNRGLGRATAKKLAAAGYAVGKSLYEHDLIPTAHRIIAAAHARSADVERSS